MKSTSNITGKGDKSTQVGAASQERKLISTISLIVLGASLFMLVAMTIILHQGFMATGENGLLTYVVGMLAIVVFIWLSTSLALRFSSSKKAKPAQHKEEKNSAGIYSPSP